MKKSFSVIISIMMCLGLFSIRGLSKAEASFDDYECAIFPASIMNIICLAYEQENNNGSGANHGGQNAFDMVPTVDVVAPFTGKIVNLDTTWGYVVLQSCDENGNPKKVHYADGSLDYMTACFMHDNDISDLVIKKESENPVIKQGEPFYQQGSAGGSYGAHVHVSVDRGLTNGVRNGYFGNGDVYGFDAFFIDTDFTTIWKKGSVEGTNIITRGDYRDWSNLWRNLKDFDPEPPVIDGEVEAAFLCFDDGSEGCWLSFYASDNIGLTNYYVNVWEYGQTEIQAKKLNGEYYDGEIKVLLDPRELNSLGPFYVKAYASDAAGNQATAECAPIDFYRCVADENYIATYSVVADSLDYYAYPETYINGKSTKVGSYSKGTKLSSIGVDVESYYDEYYQEIGPSMLQLENGSWIVYHPDLIEHYSWMTALRDHLLELKGLIIACLVDYGIREVSQLGSITVHAATYMEPATIFIDSGTWGKHEWTLDKYGQLTISGTGYMSLFSYNDERAWRIHKDDIKAVIIRDGVTSIGGYAFDGCANLIDITFPTSVSYIGSHAFIGCTGLTNVAIPESVTSIFGYAFYGCTGLRNITIPGNIDRYAFYGCSSLESVTILEGVTSIDEAAFANCSNLVDVSIPSTVTNIGKQAFMHCNSLLNATIPDGVRTINDTTFYDCKSLKTVSIPSSVTSIGEQTFWDCTSLTNINIPENVTSIGSDAFLNCSSLTSISIPGSVSNISFRCFEGCTKLEEVIISEGVTGISSDAFAECTSLTKVTIPSSVTYVGSDAFWNCDSINQVYISDIASWCEIEFDNEYHIAFNNDYDLYLNGEIVTNLVVPEGVMNLRENAFNHCTSLTSVVISSDVNNIGDSAFNSCANLRTVTLSEGVISIGKYAFSNCINLQSVIIPVSLTSIGDSAFLYCTSLTSIEIPERVTKIGKSAFYHCNNLTDTAIPTGVTTIYESTFLDCSSLTSVTIPDSVTSIEGWAFFGCDSLETVYYLGTQERWEEVNVGVPNDPLISAVIVFASIMPDPDLILPASLTTIEEETFSGGAFIYVKLPELVVSIGKNAFSDCPNLMYIYIPAVTTQIDDQAFGTIQGLTILGKTGTTAEIYAQAHHFAFIAVA